MQVWARVGAEEPDRRGETAGVSKVQERQLGPAIQVQAQGGIRKSRSLNRTGFRFLLLHGVPVQVRARMGSQGPQTSGASQGVPQVQERQLGPALPVPQGRWS